MFFIFIVLFTFVFLYFFLFYFLYFLVLLFVFFYFYFCFLFTFVFFTFYFCFLVFLVLWGIFFSPRGNKADESVFVVFFPSSYQTTPPLHSLWFWGSRGAPWLLRASAWMAFLVSCCIAPALRSLSLSESCYRQTSPGFCSSSLETVYLL